MPASRSSKRLVDVGDAEPVGAAGERGARDRDRAVAVGVRLDDGHDARRGATALARWCARCGAIASRSMTASRKGAAARGSSRLIVPRPRATRARRTRSRCRRRGSSRGAPGRCRAPRTCAASAARQREVGVALGVLHDPHVVPADHGVTAERLDERLLGGEAGGERAQPGDRAFALGEQPLEQARACARASARSARCRPRRCRCRRSRASLRAARSHSTVTDFARLRGWSTSRPFACASSIAKICSGTTASSGSNSGAASGMRDHLVGERQHRGVARPRRSR